MRAAELAARFEVTTRTIERDLLALQEAGVPIWARSGPGGGYGLNADATLPPLNLTSDEAIALSIALAVLPVMPYAEAGRSALTKLAAVMAPGAKAAAGELVRRIRVTPLAAAPSEPVSAPIQRALVDPVALTLVYLDWEGHETERTVEPAGLLGSDHGWHLVAWRRLRQAARTFRLDRIVRVAPTGEAITAPSLDALLAELPRTLIEPGLPVSQSAGTPPASSPRS